MKKTTDKENILDIKNALQYPKTVLEIMLEKKIYKGRFPEYFLTDALNAIKRIVRLLNKMAKFDEK